MSQSKPPPSLVPPTHGGNGKYIAVALVLLLGIGGLVAWRVTQKPPPTPTPVTVATSATALPPPKFDDVPPPPPVEDAGPDTGPGRTESPGSADPELGENVELF